MFTRSLSCSETWFIGNDEKLEGLYHVQDVCFDVSLAMTVVSRVGRCAKTTHPGCMERCSWLRHVEPTAWTGLEMCAQRPAQAAGDWVLRLL